MNNNFMAIEEYWDTGANLTSEDDPKEEYEAYLKIIKKQKEENEEPIFTLQDFERYIDYLKNNEE